MKMRVKDLLKMLGDGLYCIFDIIWDFEEDGKEEVKEHSVKTEDIKAVAELFGEWEVAKEDSLFVTPKDENTVLITIYVYNPKQRQKKLLLPLKIKKLYVLSVVQNMIQRMIQKKTNINVFIVVVSG